MIVKSSVIGGLVSGVAATPALLYAYVIRPMYSVASNPSGKPPAERAAIVHNANNATQIIYALGALFLLALIVYIAFGLYLGYRNEKDLLGDTSANG